jgi:hypothetical protein
MIAPQICLITGAVLHFRRAAKLKVAREAYRKLADILVAEMDSALARKRDIFGLRL